MTITRSVDALLQARPTMEGAGVQLKRGFAFGQEYKFDPFLLFDDFSGDEPSKFIAGFPWHPHRGIETITYLLEGDVAHGNSMGNSGVIHPGDVQWMTAGSGIIHQEMPEASPLGTLIGFQLWANLPAKQKMISPRYLGIESSQIPTVETEGVMIRIICGMVDGVQGPVKEVAIQPEYIDITLQPDTTWEHPTQTGHTAFAYMVKGSMDVGGENNIRQNTVILFSDGEQISVATGKEGARFLLISGKPLHEPIAWGGPIVMNTQEELQTAFAEYRAGTFIKS